MTDAKGMGDREIIGIDLAIGPDKTYFQHNKRLAEVTVDIAGNYLAACDCCSWRGRNGDTQTLGVMFAQHLCALKSIQEGE